MIYCLFEQSGVFKNAFKSLGFEAVDIDLKDDFKQTDRILNLFSEIEKASNNEKSFFDELKKDDLIFAFFPCTRFQTQTPLLSRGESFSHKKWDDEKKLQNSINIVKELEFNYNLFCKMFLIALKKGFKMIVENPYSKPNFLRDYFPIKASVVIENRAKYGDLYRKPTQFWFINTKPSFNLVLKNEKEVALSINKVRGENGITRQVRRSLISDEFALNFIKEFILSADELRLLSK